LEDLRIVASANGFAVSLCRCRPTVPTALRRDVIRSARYFYFCLLRIGESAAIVLTVINPKIFPLPFRF